MASFTLLRGRVAIPEPLEFLRANQTIYYHRQIFTYQLALVYPIIILFCIPFHISVIQFSSTSSERIPRIWITSFVVNLFKWYVKQRIRFQLSCTLYKFFDYFLTVSVNFTTLEHDNFSHLNRDRHRNLGIRSSIRNDIEIILVQIWSQSIVSPKMAFFQNFFATRNILFSDSTHLKSARVAVTNQEFRGLKSKGFCLRKF